MRTAMVSCPLDAQRESQFVLAGANGFAGRASSVAALLDTCFAQAL